MGTATDTFNSQFAPQISQSPLFSEAIITGGQNVAAAIDEYEALAAPTAAIGESAAAVGQSLAGAFQAEGEKGAKYAQDSIAAGATYLQDAATKFSATDPNEVFVNPANAVANATASALTVGVNNAAGAGSAVLGNLQAIGTEAFAGNQIFGNDYTDNIEQGAAAVTAIAENAQDVPFELGDYLQGNDPVAFGETVEAGLTGIIEGSVEGNLTGDDDSVVQNVQDIAAAGSENLASGAEALFNAGADGGNFLSEQVIDDVQRGGVAILESAEDLVGELPTNGVDNLATGLDEVGEAVDVITSQPKQLSDSAEPALIAASAAVSGVGANLADNFYSEDSLAGPIGDVNPEAGNLAEGVVEGTDQVADYMQNAGDYLVYNNGSNGAFQDKALVEFIVGEAAGSEPPQSEMLTDPLNENVFSAIQTQVEDNFADKDGQFQSGLGQGTTALNDGINEGQSQLSAGIIAATQGAGAATFGIRTFVSEFQNAAGGGAGGGDTELPFDPTTIPGSIQEGLAGLADMAPEGFPPAGGGDTELPFDPTTIPGSIQEGLAGLADMAPEGFPPAGGGDTGLPFDPATIPGAIQEGLAGLADMAPEGFPPAGGGGIDLPFDPTMIPGAIASGITTLTGAAESFPPAGFPMAA